MTTAETKLLDSAKGCFEKAKKAAGRLRHGHDVLAFILEGLAFLAAIKRPHTDPPHHD